MFTYKILIIAIIVICIGLFGACKVDTPTPIISSADQIEAYLTANNLSAVAQETESGLHYIIEEESVGPHPAISSVVTVHYRGTLVDGTVFDSSYERGQPSSFSLGGVIAGWREGMLLFKRGGSGKLIVPFELAYGSTGNGDIPPNTIIIFDIELFDFSQ
ncbi:MAG: FKBP-type peptidyl-prolyl cis-trans isomerase [Chitinophagales bacterium]